MEGNTTTSTSTGNTATQLQPTGSLTGFGGDQNVQAAPKTTDVQGSGSGQPVVANLTNNPTTVPLPTSSTATISLAAPVRAAPTSRQMNAGAIVWIVIIAIILGGGAVIWARASQTRQRP